MRFSSFLIPLTFAVSLLAGCGGGGGSPGATTGTGGNGGTSDTPAPLATTAPAGLTLQFGEAQAFTISGGTAPYTAVSNNASVAAGAVNGSTLTVGGVGAGTATVTVVDAKNATVPVSVTVSVRDLVTSAPSSGVTVAIGSSNAQSYSISGGVAPYSVTSSNVNVATATMPTASTVLITGVNAGSASVVVRDGTNKAVTVPVTVTAGLALFTTAPSSLNLSVGSGPTYTISGGVAPYTVTSSNPGVVVVARPTSTSFTIGAIANGSASVVVRDALGASTSTAVTVSSTALTLNPSSGTALVGDVLYSTITGGSGSYTATVTNAAVADADIVTINGQRALRINIKQQASGVPIIVTDANGTTASFNLTSSPGQPAMQISPIALSVSACVNTPITLTLYGAGTGTTHFFSSDPSLFTVPGSQSTTSGTAAAFSVTPGTLVGGQVVTITAIDPAGAAATSTITVTTPVGACPP